MYSCIGFVDPNKEIIMCFVWFAYIPANPKSSAMRLLLIGHVNRPQSYYQWTAVPQVRLGHAL
jgi:hypothetical protein